MTSQTPVIGIDVAKESLSLCHAQSGEVFELPNDSRSIKAWLKTLPANCAIAIEATGIYHMDVATLAHARGHRIYVINGFRLSNYRKGIGGRNKDDRSDAQLLARYLAHEQAQLEPWQPPSKAYCRLQTLLHRRAALVRSATSLRQSFSQDRQLTRALQPVLKRMAALEQRLEKDIREALREAGLMEQSKRCQAIEGIGLLTAAALNLAFLRGHFRNSDAFIAFLGLDVRLKESGRYCGRRKLTKQGDPEIRRLLHNAAMAAARTQRWKSLYQGYLMRGLKKTEALTILARKLARIAFALMQTQTAYHPQEAKPH
ncbi:IS110 family RNA-guided transposase [Pseudomonas schmalbachii]|uniref:IS110 family transposase n=1 Tax=Pseudomonas schmalbachii TaxID=2816993 RepID=A0ABS3TY52_9PSED|nr:IS110 family transposase [Pseudomonas schmalbachii]MBO3278318.1 IS110 family transposase [Pseudomonas schmalbachii]